ncbi:hypothetical protein CJF32_00000772 [Rutstroemia sp. NJR-2017a WRK4]|nr:hypothetical protein CJF32_00000772 [Rutstroemia sp. NJR-2017a WRK4]
MAELQGEYYIYWEMMDSAYRRSRSSDGAHSYQELVHVREYSWKGDKSEIFLYVECQDACQVI